MLIKSLENQDGYAILSRAAAMQVQSWERLRQAHQNHETIKGRVIERIKGGLNVDLDGVPAFLPGSQIDIRPGAQPRRLPQTRRSKSASSSSIASAATSSSRAKRCWRKSPTRRRPRRSANIEEGVVLEGAVKNITDYGAFIDLGGIDGLLHIIDMSWGRIQSPNDIIKVGDTHPGQGAQVRPREGTNLARLQTASARSVAKRRRALSQRARTFAARSSA